jgi:hypothetical protein
MFAGRIAALVQEPSATNVAIMVLVAVPLFFLGWALSRNLPKPPARYTS